MKNGVEKKMMKKQERPVEKNEWVLQRGSGICKKN